MWGFDLTSVTLSLDDNVVPLIFDTAEEGGLYTENE